MITKKVINNGGCPLIITRATEYAIRAVLFMASREPGVTVLKKDICRSMKITPAFLTKILQPLIKCGIVGSQRGVGGGFLLQKKPQDISLLDVIAAEEGMPFLNTCLIEHDNCERRHFCPVSQVWQEARVNLLATLQQYTFAQLVQLESRNQDSLPAPIQVWLAEDIEGAATGPVCSGD
jgi:Rrf2 family protein